MTAKRIFRNTLYTNDNLYVLSGLNSGLVDLIYLDPPFNSKRMYSAPVGSKAAGSSFKDMWTWQDVNEAYLDTLAGKYPALTKFIASIGEIHSKAMMAYLTYMAQRIIEMHRVLKDTGSLFLHCDVTASHYLKILLDEVFGKNHFRNEIIWKRTNAKGLAFTRLARNNDTILYYAKSGSFTFHGQYVPHSEKYVSGFYKYVEPETGRHYRLDNLANPNKDRPNLTYEFLGVTRVWRWTKKRMKEAYKKGLIVQTKPGGVPRLKRYLDEQEGTPIDDNWLDIVNVQGTSKERTGYPTQKPLKLLHRIIKLSSNEGDIVFDPFCGCATTCVAAQQLDRKWIGIDIEKQAVDILVERLSDDAGLFKDFVNTTIVPQRTDVKYEPKSPSVKDRLYQEQNGLCNGCGNEYLIKDLEIDHIIPTTKGGGDYYENYQLLCSSCNKIKGVRPMEYLRLKIQTREAMMKNQIIFGE